ncbi:MAG: UDP-N-acetylmuramoyl-L-alanyl-D-glutamate--2,6-diaminopimelate ligase [Bacteroidetes bacterium]|nr:UDP-N-acetylmuramoyl-L-alanyl-D-glutamate--2,6-diaminopimelate ligase [Bacteroidota bacterium]
MHFSTCIDRLKDKGLLVSFSNPLNVQCDRLAIDSREVGQSNCFVAIKGTHADGHLFIDKAVKNGAIAIVSEVGPEDEIINGDRSQPRNREVFPEDPSGPAFARVTNSHHALSELASLLNGDPGRELKLIATTGTNGKTTVATLVSWVLNQSGTPAGFLGTTGYRYGVVEVEASHTTPSAIVFHELLAGMVQSGMKACSIEASSHAIDQSRFRTSDVDVAIFTNLTRDHLDYHQTFENYQASKKKLFDELVTSSCAVTNLDDERGLVMVSNTKGKVTSYGQSTLADITYAIRGNALSGLVLDLDGTTTTFKLAGAFNAANLVAAYTACLSLGMESTIVRESLAACPPVIGRMEAFQTETGSTVILDYAHTPDALENVLSTVRESLSKGSSLWCVFGCGGDRDRGKRPQMGAIAEKWADHVVVTSDNPRTENALDILDDIKKGFKHENKALWMVDRREAIATAVSRMSEGDTLVLAGKGHETYQVIGTEKIHFDDKVEAMHAFRSIGQPIIQGRTVGFNS